MSLELKKQLRNQSNVKILILVIKRMVNKLAEEKSTYYFAQVPPHPTKRSTYYMSPLSFGWNLEEKSSKVNFNVNPLLLPVLLLWPFGASNSQISIIMGIYLTLIHSEELNSVDPHLNK